LTFTNLNADFGKLFSFFSDNDPMSSLRAISKFISDTLLKYSIRAKNSVHIIRGIIKSVAEENSSDSSCMPKLKNVEELQKLNCNSIY